MEFIKRALTNGIMEDYIVPKAVNNYVDCFASDRRYKLKWLASDYYKKGCSSGIISYKGREYYFSLMSGNLEIKYN